MEEIASRYPLQEATKECLEAITLVAQSPGIKGVDFAKYKLISVENLMSQSSVWQFTFKPRELLPQTPESRIGAGGEIFVRLDVRSRSITLSGYGE
jgi:hypothetical protein